MSTNSGVANREYRSESGKVVEFKSLDSQFIRCMPPGKRDTSKRAKIERAIKKVPGVKNVDYMNSSGAYIITCHLRHSSFEEITDAVGPQIIAAIEYTAPADDPGTSSNSVHSPSKKQSFVKRPKSAFNPRPVPATS